MKPLAKKLITKYGSLASILNTDHNLLLDEVGIGESVIAALLTVREAAVRLIKDDLTQKPVLASWKSLLDYCRATMGHIKTEQFRVIYLDKKNMLIADELQETGTIDHTPVYPREIIKQAMYHHASAIILVHNHPSGITKPSAEDIAVTKKIIQAAEIMNIIVHDHIIISNRNHFSFKTSGIM